jgi:ubiquinone/menaquinone biosynthesis C-methylase UbiE
MVQNDSWGAVDAYERYYVPAMFLPWAKILLHHAAVRSGERVLDVACGTGIVAREVAPLVGSSGRVAGVDVSAAMLAVARSLPAPSGATITWHEGNAMALPFPDASFNVALCQHGLPFFSDRAGAVREMRRTLLPQGRAVAIVLQGLERHVVFRALLESVARQLSIPVAEVAGPFALSDADELRSHYVKAGFHDVDVRRVSTSVRFPEAEQFVTLAVASSAAVIPAFAELQAEAKASLLEAVRVEMEPIVREHRVGESLAFPMFAHLAVCTG